VLFAAIASTQDERLFEGAVMRSLGASRRQLTVLQLAEFLAIGSLAGLIGAVGAVAIAYVLSDRVLGVAYVVNLLVPVGGFVLGTLGVVGAGLLGTRAAVNAPPLQALRALG
jgi:putative ABC transport system permease protein